jgi:hypothetical protein
MSSRQRTRARLPSTNGNSPRALLLTPSRRWSKLVVVLNAATIALTVISSCSSAAQETSINGNNNSVENNSYNQFQTEIPDKPSDVTIIEQLRSFGLLRLKPPHRGAS